MSVVSLKSFYGWWMIRTSNPIWLTGPHLIRVTCYPCAWKIFEKSGYAIIKDSWDASSNYLCFDFGPIADGLSHKAIPSAAMARRRPVHWPVRLWEPFLVDGGFYTYFGDHQWHKFFRMEEAHNTFTVEGFRQADYVDRLKWQKVRSPELMFWKNEPAFAACAGKVKYTQNVTAIRNVWYQKKNFWVINDVVWGPFKVQCDSLLQFPSRCQGNIKPRKMWSYRRKCWDFLAD